MNIHNGKKFTHPRDVYVAQFQNKGVMGYFQLFHSSKTDVYSETSNTCALDDTLFVRKWDLHCRKILPFVVTHFGVPFDEERWKGRRVGII